MTGACFPNAFSTWGFTNFYLFGGLSLSIYIYIIHTDSPAACCVFDFLSFYVEYGDISVVWFQKQERKRRGDGPLKDSAALSDDNISC